jgi:carotenoid 1,2-hydratase
VAQSGYRWWYLDALSDDGRHALVVIAFIGSVFSPAYYRAQARGLADPYRHCALNVALYSPGASRWAFTHYGRHKVRCTPHELDLASNHMHWSSHELSCELDERCAPWPHRVQGSVRLDTRLQSGLRLALSADGRHTWQALVPRGRVSVAFEHPKLQWEGIGYFDSNCGIEPLHRGFRTWTWLRAHHRDSTFVVYDAQPVRGPPIVHALRFGHEEVHRLSQPLQHIDQRKSIWRMRRDIAADVGGAATVLRTLESAPFYERSLVRTSLAGMPVTAMHESLSLERFQSAWVRALLPFRIRRSRL